MALRDLNKIRIIIALLIIVLSLDFLYNHPGSNNNNNSATQSGSCSNNIVDRNSLAIDSKMFSAEELLFFTAGKKKPGSGDVRKRLIENIRTRFAKPSGINPKLTLKHYSQFGQSVVVDKLLAGHTNGFFFERGAFDGEFLSNSLFFELARNWTGLLIEANPAQQEELLGKGRNAFIFPMCLSLKTVPSVVHFKLQSVFSGISEMLKHNNKKNASKRALNCFPIHDVLDAICVKHIDYFSLHVEGAELMILKTMDFAWLTLDIFSIEYNHNLKTLEELQTFFKDLHAKTGQLYECYGASRRK